MPSREKMDLYDAITMYGRAIHWLICWIIFWPDFEEKESFQVESASLVANDPDLEYLPEAFHKQLANIIETFWKIQLNDLYPSECWSVKKFDDDKLNIKVEAKIFKPEIRLKKRIIVPDRFHIEDLSLYTKKMQYFNSNKQIDEKLLASKYMRAINWISFFGLIWPDFSDGEWHYIDMVNLICQDPDYHELPHILSEYFAQMLGVFWRIRLEDLSEDGDYYLYVCDDDPYEVFIEAKIKKE